jgi:hypothetical protein
MRIFNLLAQPIHVGAGRDLLRLEPGVNEVPEALFAKHEETLRRAEAAGKVRLSPPPSPVARQEILEAKGIVKSEPVKKTPNQKKKTK